MSVPCLPPGSSLTSEGGVKIGPMTNSFASSRAFARNSGVKSIRSSSVSPLRENGAGLVGKGCVGAACSPGTVDGGTGRSSIGHTGLPVTRSKTYRKPVLLGCITALIRLPSTVISPKVAGPTVSYSHRSWCTV